MTRRTLSIVAAAMFLALACAGMVLGNMTRQETLSGDPGRSEVKNGVLSLSGTFSQSKLYSRGDGLVGLLLTLRADDIRLADQPARSVDLVVVLDRSGSMAGEKIEDARRAVNELISGLGDTDRIALVSYSTDVTVHTPLTHAGPGNRALLESMVRGIVANGGTNLGGGLDMGMALMDQGGDSRRLGRVVLVSDGHANHGVTSPAELGRMARRAHSRGYSVTTVGVGVDYNEQLMATVADEGGGNYYFLENPAAFAEVFQRELRLTRAVAASAVEIRLPLTNGIELVHAAGYPVEMQGNTAVFRPGPVRSGQTRELFVTLRMPTGREAEYTLKGLSAGFDQDGARRNMILEQPLSVSCIADESAAVASLRPDVWEKQVLQEEYGKLREQVAEDVMRGDEAAAMSKIENYEKKQRAYNQTAGSEKVARNLDTDLQELEAQVRMSTAPNAAPETTKRAAKAMQSEAYDQRRSKMKQ
ncbi:MAG: VWA domain-containing protein [Desulfovibrionaceae bacterium]